MYIDIQVAIFECSVLRIIQSGICRSTKRIWSRLVQRDDDTAVCACRSLMNMGSGGGRNGGRGVSGDGGNGGGGNGGGGSDLLCNARVSGSRKIPYIKLGTGKRSPVRYRRTGVSSYLDGRTGVNSRQGQAQDIASEGEQ
jgi:hypothetical protein